MSETRLKIAVFIDFDNIEIGVKTTLGGHFDVGAVLEAIKERGEVVTKIAYGDWTRAGDYSRSLTQHAIHMVQRNLTPGGDKNGADINLALDALEMAFTHSHINAFVIVGGDSDFMALVEKLKQYDRKVFVVGGRAFTSVILQKNCTEFIAYENLVGTSPRKVGGRAVGRPGETPAVQAVPLIKRALKVLTDREVSPQLGVLKSTLLQLDSTFSEREYGASTFRDFVQRLARAGYLTLKGTERNIYVELKEGADGAGTAGSAGGSMSGAAATGLAAGAASTGPGSGAAGVGGATSLAAAGASGAAGTAAGSTGTSREGDAFGAEIAGDLAPPIEGEIVGAGGVASGSGSGSGGSRDRRGGSRWERVRERERDIAPVDADPEAAAEAADLTDVNGASLAGDASERAAADSASEVGGHRVDARASTGDTEADDDQSDDDNRGNVLRAGEVRAADGRRPFGRGPDRRDRGAHRLPEGGRGGDSGRAPAQGGGPRRDTPGQGAGQGGAQGIAQGAGQVTEISGPAGSPPAALRFITDVFQRPNIVPRWPLYLRQVKQILKSVDETFDERRYGFSGIVEALRYCQREGLFRLDRDRQGVLRVYPGPTLQRGATPATPAGDGDPRSTGDAVATARGDEGEGRDSADALPETLDLFPISDSSAEPAYSAGAADAAHTATDDDTSSRGGSGEAERDADDVEDAGGTAVAVGTAAAPGAASSSEASASGDAGTHAPARRGRGSRRAKPAPAPAVKKPANAKKPAAAAAAKPRAAAAAKATKKTRKATKSGA